MSLHFHQGIFLSGATNTVVLEIPYHVVLFPTRYFPDVCVTDFETGWQEKVPFRLFVSKLEWSLGLANKRKASQLNPSREVAYDRFLYVPLSHQILYSKVPKELSVYSHPRQRARAVSVFLHTIRVRVIFKYDCPASSVIYQRTPLPTLSWLVFLLITCAHAMLSRAKYPIWLFVCNVHLHKKYQFQSQLHFTPEKV